MVAGYTPLVPTLGTLTTAGAATLLLLGYAVFVAWRRRQDGARHVE